MLALEELLKTMFTLLGENGCAWDKAQTMLSMRSSLLEETCEAIEAIDSGDKFHIQEELGDLLFNAIFLCLLAEKEGCSQFQAIVHRLNEKLIYRHPHIFGDAKKLSNPDAVLEQWDKLKTKEQGKEMRESALDGIPKALPALARAQKVLKKMKRQGFTPNLVEGASQEVLLGHSLLKLVMEAQAHSIEAEFALRNVLDQAETAFRHHEKRSANS
jgi:tetrapyrrole methylase family protein / MazG family protein